MSPNLGFSLKKFAKHTAAFAKALDSRDEYTANHSQNVAHYAEMIAKELGWSRKQCEDIYIGGLLHDIGKIGVPEAILTSPKKLTFEEYEQIKQHPVMGYQILEPILVLNKNGVLEIVRFHHERYDDKGYPDGPLHAPLT